MALEAKEAKVIRRFAEAIEGFVNSAAKEKLSLDELSEGVLTIITKGQNRVITLLLKDSPAIGEQVKKDFHALRQQANEGMRIVVDGCNDNFILELTFNSIVNNVRQLAQRLRDAVGDKDSIPSGRQQGRPRKYLDKMLEGGLKLYESSYAEIKDSKRAWHKVSELIEAPSGDAARKACTNYQKKKLEKSI